MPHYKNGEKASIGHIVSAQTSSNGTVIGPVTTIYEGTDTCNLSVGFGLQIIEGENGARVISPLPFNVTVNAKDAERVK